MEQKKNSKQGSVSERFSQNDKVLIGMSDSLDSLVAAYLLKIQRHNLVAVTIVNIWDDAVHAQTDGLSCYYTDEQIKFIRDFCHKLDIPHQILRLGDEFIEKVVEAWVADLLENKSPKHCFKCHDLKLTALLTKMKEVGASRFATGHYAKLFQLDSHSPNVVHTSNDLLHDQSSLLSSLPADLLAHLMLPLAELTKKEVLLLADNFGIQTPFSQPASKNCLNFSPALFSALEKRVPKDLALKLGVISKEGQSIGLGLFEKINQNSKLDNKVWVINCHVSFSCHSADPFSGYMMTKDHQIIDCWIYPKTISTYYLEFSENFNFKAGEVVSILKKKGKNSKVFFSGELRLIPDEEEGENGVTKVDPTLDF
jgi:hypothetical protein